MLPVVCKASMFPPNLQQWLDNDKAKFLLAGGLNTTVTLIDEAWDYERKSADPRKICIRLRVTNPLIRGGVRREGGCRGRCRERLESALVGFENVVVQRFAGENDVADDRLAEGLLAEVDLFCAHRAHG